MGRRMLGEYARCGAECKCGGRGGAKRDPAPSTGVSLSGYRAGQWQAGPPQLRVLRGTLGRGAQRWQGACQASRLRSAAPRAQRGPFNRHAHARGGLVRSGGARTCARRHRGRECVRASCAGTQRGVSRGCGQGPPRPSRWLEASEGRTESAAEWARARARARERTRHRGTGRNLPGAPARSPRGAPRARPLSGAAARRPRRRGAGASGGTRRRGERGGPGPPSARGPPRPHPAAGWVGRSGLAGTLRPSAWVGRGLRPGAPAPGQGSGALGHRSGVQSLGSGVLGWGPSLGSSGLGLGSWVQAPGPGLGPGSWVLGPGLWLGLCNLGAGRGPGAHGRGPEAAGRGRPPGLGAARGSPGPASPPERRAAGRAARTKSSGLCSGLCCSPFASEERRVCTFSGDFEVRAW